MKIEANARIARLVLGVVLGALIWLWPVTYGPLSQFWPNFVAWLSGLALWLVLLPSGSEDRTRIIVSGWLAAALPSALLGMVQYFDGDAAWFPLLAQAMPGHAFANTRQVNHLATLLSAGLLCVVYLMQVGQVRLRGALLLGLPIAVALAGTASRGGAVQLMLVGAVVLLFGLGGLRSPVFRWWLVMALVYVAAMFALPALLQLVSGEMPDRQLLNRMAVESTCSSRLVLWRNVWDLIEARPWGGWGWEGLRLGHYMTDFNGHRFCAMLTNAHNLPLHLATELGVPFAVLVTVGTALAVAWARPWAEPRPDAQLGWSVLMVVGFHSMVEYPVWFGNFQTMVLLALWLLWPGLMARRWSAPQAPHDGQKARLKPLHLWSASALTVGLLAMAFDYVRVTQLYLPQGERLASYQTDTLNKVRHSLFFRDWVLFAQVVAITPDAGNAALVLEGAQEALRISPEPRVIERVIVSASLLGRSDLVSLHSERYRQAWPEQYATWRAAQRGQVTPRPEAVSGGP